MSRPLEIATLADIKPEEAIIYMASEIKRLTDTILGLQREVSRLSTKIEQPDRIKYTVGEACKRMKVGRSTIYKFMNAGELAYEEVTIGESKKRRITETAVQSWERKNRQ